MQKNILENKNVSYNEQNTARSGNKITEQKQSLTWRQILTQKNHHPLCGFATEIVSPRHKNSWPLLETLLDLKVATLRQDTS